MSVAISVLLLMSKGTFPKVSAIAVLYPSMVVGRPPVFRCTNVDSSSRVFEVQQF